MRLVMAAGGTGGHVFPGLALAVELMQRGAELAWVGRPEGLEHDLAAEHGIRFESVPAVGLSGKTVWGRVRWPSVFLAGTVRAARVIERFEPDALISGGGYVAAAPLAGAMLTRTPFFLLEQNRVPGRVTRAFARWARECFAAFPVPAGKLPGTWSVTGSPLRPEIRAGGRQDDGRTVLVLGGSQGARALNIAALDAAAALTNLRFVVLTGSRDYSMVKSRLRSKNCRLVEFTARPEELYRQATIAVSRAGGMVLSELVAFGIPAILVPFPYATDRHQDANALYLASAGAATILDQSRLSGLVSLIRTLMDDEARRERMSRSALAVARPDAARTVAERVVGHCRRTMNDER